MLHLNTSVHYFSNNVKGYFTRFCGQFLVTVYLCTGFLHTIRNKNIAHADTSNYSLRYTAPPSQSCLDSFGLPASKLRPINLFMYRPQAPHSPIP